jgi:two-component system, OmpR family, response regulator
MVYLPAYSVGCKLAGQADGKLTAFHLLRQLPVRLMAQCRAVVRQRVKILRVLLIEDDEVLGSAVRDQIVADGHSVDWSRRLDDARDHLGLAGYELVLLDLMLPDGRGLDLLRGMRRAGDATPVVILTALDQISDRIAGLNAGADDYLVKPFDLSELSARIGSVSRRYHGNPNPQLRIGDLAIDLAARSVRKAGGEVTLTAREWALFEALVQRRGAILSKPQLEERLYSFDQDVDSNAIEVHVSRLRKKLGPDILETVRGMGYRLAAS